MAHWLGGGTVSSEGLAWGWRVLSPTQPFTEGADYDESTKIIVLMTDGMNWAAQNPNPSFRSDYTSYNALGLWQDWYPGTGPRLGSINQFSDYLDSRMEAVCRNAKEEGVKVYTVVFREPDTNIRQLLQQCATSNEYAFTAESETELAAAFAAIAQSIAKLRLTR
jgi:hypothetical protein